MGHRFRKAPDQLYFTFLPWAFPCQPHAAHHVLIPPNNGTPQHMRKRKSPPIGLQMLGTLLDVQMTGRLQRLLIPETGDHFLNPLHHGRFAVHHRHARDDFHLAGRPKIRANRKDTGLPKRHEPPRFIGQKKAEFFARLRRPRLAF